MRVRYLTAKGFKNFKITKKDTATKTYLLLRKDTCQDHEENSSELQRYQKVIIISNYAFCTCLGYFNTGLPCEHVLLVAVTEKQKFMVHSRWCRKYESVMYDMEDIARNERFDKIHEQIMRE